MSALTPRRRHNLLNLAVEGAVLVTAFTVAMGIMIDVADWPHTPCLIGLAATVIAWEGVFKIIGQARSTRLMTRLHWETRKKIKTEIRKEVQNMTTRQNRGNVWAQAFADTECPPQTNGRHLHSVDN